MADITPTFSYDDFVRFIRLGGNLWTPTETMYQNALKGEPINGAGSSTYKPEEITLALTSYDTLKKAYLDRSDASLGNIAGMYASQVVNNTQHPDFAITTTQGLQKAGSTLESYASQQLGASDYLKQGDGWIGSFISNAAPYLPAINEGIFATELALATGSVLAPAVSGAVGGGIGGAALGGAAAGAAAGTTAGALTTVEANGNIGDYLKNTTTGALIGGAAGVVGGGLAAGSGAVNSSISGALTDTVGSTTANALAGAATGAGTQAIGNVIGQELSTGKIDWGKVGTSSVGGAIGGATAPLNDDLNYYLQSEKGWSPTEASAFTSGLSSAGGNALAQEIINGKIDPNSLTTAAVTGLINGTLNPTEWEGIGDNPYNTTATGVTVPSSLVASGVNALNPQSTSAGTKAPTTATTPTPTGTNALPTKTNTTAVTPTTPYNAQNALSLNNLLAYSQQNQQSQNQLTAPRQYRQLYS